MDLEKELAGPAFQIRVLLEVVLLESWLLLPVLLEQRGGQVAASDPSKHSGGLGGWVTSNMPPKGLS